MGGQNEQVKLISHSKGRGFWLGLGSQLITSALGGVES